MDVKCNAHRSQKRIKAKHIVSSLSAYFQRERERESDTLSEHMLALTIICNIEWVWCCNIKMSFQIAAFQILNDLMQKFIFLSVKDYYCQSSQSTLTQWLQGYHTSCILYLFFQDHKFLGVNVSQW